VSFVLKTSFCSALYEPGQVNRRTRSRSPKEIRPEYRLRVTCAYQAGSRSQPIAYHGRCDPALSLSGDRRIEK
jgi:hypothetical protein